MPATIRLTNAQYPAAERIVAVDEGAQLSDASQLNPDLAVIRRDFVMTQLGLTPMLERSVLRAGLGGGDGGGGGDGTGRITVLISRGRRSQHAVRLLVTLSLILLVPRINAQTSGDTAAIRGIVQEEIAAWDQGDAGAYARHVAPEATFTNIRGQFFSGHDAFLHQHDVIFRGIFKNTKLHQDIVSLRFLTPEVAVVEVLTSVTGVTRPPPRMTLDRQGRLRTRLLQVVAKQARDWEIVVYHNVDVKPGVPLPDPR